MEMSSFDRTPNARPLGAEWVPASPSRTQPPAPLNPPLAAEGAAEPAPGVVNHINPALKVSQGEAVYHSVSDPGQHGSEAATSQKDWTVRRPAPEPVDQPAPKPVSQVLIDHIKSVWNVNASPVQIEQVRDQLQPPQAVTPSDMPGVHAKEVLTYSPSKIKKNEKI
ncbi:MAG: hypothetical protein WCK83_13455 [Burkholderiales bacterium]